MKKYVQLFDKRIFLVIIYLQIILIFLNKNMKKIFMFLWWGFVTALFCISCILAYTQEERDVYQRAYKNKLTTQPTIEAAKLDFPLTRQAFSKMIVNFVENVIWINSSLINSCYFPDENIITDDLRPYTKKVCAYQVMWLNWKKFNPTQPIDKAQLWTVLSRILWWNKYNNNWVWYYIYHLNALKQIWVMDNIQDPKIYAKRWDALAMLKRIYEKFGSGIYLNWNEISAYNTTLKQSNKKSPWNQNSRSNSWNYENEYISGLYSNSSIIYTWEDGTKYYYDDKFLSMLKNVAESKSESDLVKYLEVEAKYYKDGLDQLANLDDEALLKMMWIDTNDVELDNMTNAEKQNLIKKFKSGFTRIINENKDKNNKTLKILQGITNNISNDKFKLKEKYRKTLSFIETSNTFLDAYSESLFNLIEIAVNDNGNNNSEKWTSQALWLIWIALAYQSEAEEYQNYVEEWWIATLKLLGLN